MSAELDLHSQVILTSGIDIVTVSDDTPQVSAIIDTESDNGYYSLEFLTVTGTFGQPAATFTVVVEHGDDAALADAEVVDPQFLLPTPTETTDAYQVAAFTGADVNTQRRLGYIGKKRYVRYIVFPAGNDAAAVFTVVAMLGNPRTLPTGENQ